MAKREKIYLAGKVTKHGWRDELVPDLRFAWDGYASDRLADLDEWPILPQGVLGQWDYVGPFFTACDHGCAHDRGIHASVPNPCEGGPTDRNNIFDRCMAALSHADVVFGWLDTTDCYGTLVELGAAYALKKRVLVASPTEALPDLWFSYLCASRDGRGTGSVLVGNKYPDLALLQLMDVISPATARAKSLEREFIEDQERQEGPDLIATVVGLFE
jgi:hypothetical protein